MNITIFKDDQTLGYAAATLFAAQVSHKKDSVLGFATGSSPLPTYAHLCDFYTRGVISFRDVRTFNLDEYYGLAGDHPQSYRSFMFENLFNHIDLPVKQIDLPNGLARNTEAECQRYEDAIATAGGIDLQLLGIGRNGHIGFNEPADFFSLNTLCVSLTQETIMDNRRFFENEKDVPHTAFSMGIGTIMRARAIVLVATGRGKAEAVHGMIKGPITPRVPASILQFHPQVTVLLDADAASML